MRILKHFLTASLPLLALAVLIGCSPQEKSLFSELESEQVISGEIHNWSSAYWAEMAQEDLAQTVPLLQTLQGTPLPNAQPEPILGGIPTIRLTLSHGSQFTVTLYGQDGIDLIVTTPEGETCYDVEEQQLAPILEIIQSYHPPELPA